jgi:hypothetical protein
MTLDLLHFDVPARDRRPTAPLSQPLQRLCMVTAILILFTSSFDIFLVINAGGNYRFCQIILPLLIALAIIKASRARIIPTLGSIALCVWFGFQMAFIPATDFWPKSLGYCLWLLLNLGLVFAFVQLFSQDPQTLRRLLRWYLYSFAFIAAFGIFQFALPVLGLPGILITQWWIPGTLPRINGFSYEPSYFACYLLIGFVLVSSLKRARSTLLPSRALLAIYCLTAVGIVISSSRIGIIFLLAEVLLAAMRRPWLAFFSDIRRLRIVPSNVRRLIPSLVSLALILTVSGGTVIVLENNPVLLLMFLNGTGVSDTPAHSFIQRENSFEETIAVFIQHPFIGRSLGGISSAIAEYEGDTIRSFEDAKKIEGMSVFAEVLAASGVIGFIPFVYFLVATIWKPLTLARIAPPFYSSLLYGLVRSLVFAWAILQFNQNILRTYLWVHLAILATVYAATLRVVRNQLESSDMRDE